ncbi:IS3 family transposase [Maridesulfovibrio sp. FT414]|uniref:IS3 family transposase n=1 Tax=Maridesulfovibrio sp. FT414 TaxID=2979469 RepID=UPI003D804330
MKYAWISKQEGLYPVILLCRVLSVSRSGYYDWQKRLPSEQQKRRETIRQAASDSYQGSGGVYGYRKVHEDVIEAVGFYCCPETVRRVLAAEGMKSQTVRKHRYPKTKRDDSFAPNLLSRDFTASAPNQKWVSDITYIPTGEGWLYLAIVQDIFSRKIVGWSMSNRVDADLACNALDMAINNRSPTGEVLFHSDRGSQYTSSSFSSALHRHGCVTSMSRRGNCWDNAVAENFFSKLKRERVNRTIYKTREQARQDIFIYLEIFYNRKRRHAGIGYVSPERYEQEFYRKPKLAA